MSALDCKAGDLALVVKGPDVGKVVTCLALVTPGEALPTSLGIFLSLTAADYPAWHIDRDMTACDVPTGRLFTTRAARDANLLPIRPLSDSEDVTTEREVTA